jgi:hypothetical protein
VKISEKNAGKQAEGKEGSVSLYQISSFSDARERSKESFSESEPLRCLPPHMPKKTARTSLPHMPAVFLTHASPPSHIAADSEIINAALFGSRRNRWVRAGVGFNRRVSISVLYSNARDIRPIDAPKLSARVAGIESERYDFDKISLVTFFLGKKVTSSIRIQWSSNKTLCVPRKVGYYFRPGGGK